MEANDGMDICLVTIDIKNKTLQYSGAMNPLLVIRSNENQNHGNTHKIIEFKADIMPIAIHHNANIPFQQQNFDLKHGDTLYLFSDGYSDQFGCVNNKRFTTGQLKKVLLNIQNNSMNEQKEILDKTIEEWKGNLEQLDDILMMGIRV
jgi:serine phosphatase RsbU (regulator of sigma subunit)